MAVGSFRLKPATFDKLVMSKLKLSQWGRISYPTVLKYTSGEAANVTVFDGQTLYTMLSVGLGLSDDEIRKMTLGELFDIVEVGG